ncbi:MAG: hypothetical protein ACI9MR_000211 [Myxococcota bacterium]|jgi:hypothetical protein
MSMRRITLGFAFLLTLAFSASTAMASDTPTKQSSIRDALAKTGLSIRGEQVEFAKNGRRDLVLPTNSTKAQVVSKLKSMHKRKAIMANGYKVIGWAHINATDSYTFTLRNSKEESMVAEVVGDGPRAKVKVWGAAYSYRPNRRPISTIPRRYAPVPTVR